MTRRALLLCGVAFALAIGMACACSAFSGNGDSTPSNAGDAQQDHATSDSTSSDGSVIPGDAAVAPLDAGPPFCSYTDARFCDDFDNAPVGVGWNGPPIVTDGSSVALNDATFTSPPYSLVASTMNSSSNANNAQLTYAVSDKYQYPATLSCAFDVLDEGSTGTPPEALFVVSGVAMDNSKFSMNISLGASGSSSIQTTWSDVSSGENGGNATPKSLVSWDTTQWTRVRVDVLFNATLSVCSGTTDVYATTPGGATSQILTSYAFPLGTGGPCLQEAVSVTIGLAGSKGWIVGVDNVTCDWRP